MILSSRRLEKLEAVRRSLAAPDKAVSIALDLEKPVLSGMAHRVGEAIRAFGGVDVLVHAAGVSSRMSAEDLNCE